MQDPDAAEAGSSQARFDEPVRPRLRVDAIDIVRGFALFGVLAMNMLAFAGPVYSASPLEISSTWWDRTLEVLLRVGGEAAFQSTFSFLFGLGFAMQLDRALKRGQSLWFFVRRMIVLLGFGLAHSLFLWFGDILTSYAIGGLVLLLFARSSATTTKVWSIILALVMVGLASAALTLSFIFGAPGGLAVAANDPLLIEETDLFLNGSFADVAADQISRAPESIVFVVITTPWLLAQFLAGSWFARSGRLANLSEQGPFLRRVLRVTIPVAVITKGLYGAAILFGSPRLASTVGLPLSNMVGGSALGATYSCLVVLALRRGGAIAQKLRHLAPVGRMALTNYLSQSLIAVTFFYGWGLGFYGQLGVSAGLLCTIALFGAQMLWSRWWLQRFRFGPLEWLWRMLTYRSVPAMRLNR